MPAASDTTPAKSGRKKWPLVVLVILAIGCSSDTNAPKVDASPTLSITGVQSTYAAGEKVAISAKANRKDLRPIANLPITFASSSGGSADPATAITDANGLATTTWTVPVNAGNATLSASSGATTIQVAPNIKAAAAARINKLAGDAQQGIEGELLTNTLRVSVTDAFGNAIVGRVVTFVVTSGGGSVTISSTTTVADGSAITEWRVGVGTTANTLEVRTLELAPATFNATARLVDGVFSLTGRMSTARHGHTATLLRDGRVLVAGGMSSTSSGSELATAELYDPATGRFTPTANAMTLPRAFHSATLLADGRVLIAGGSTRNFGNASGDRTSSVDLFDPASNRFVPISNLLDSQSSHEGTLLRSGEVLVTGGNTYDIDNGTGAARAELYSPMTGLFRYASVYADTIPAGAYNGLLGVPATLLSNGTVLIATLPRAEVYDPASGAFVATGSMLTLTGLSYITGRSATLLTSGNVLLTGGEHEDAGLFKKAELYDPATGMFRFTMSMPYPRSQHTSTRLASDKVLIAGGESFGNCDARGICDMFSMDKAEVYDLTGAEWTDVGPMKIRRELQRATLLNDGRVLVTGGLTFSGGLNRPVSYTVLNSAELFTERR